MRRAHGAEAGLLAARASYLAGFAGSATVLAGAAFDIPVYGTMAHSFIETHDTEDAAFEHFARAQPNNVVLLIDTYDTEAAAHKLVELAPRLAEEGITVKAVRIDSGNLAEHARKVRKILDDGGLDKVHIFASGSVDEYLLEQMVTTEAPVDGYGVGTHMDTSADLPYLDCAYKLQEYAGRARRKRSEGKATWPGRKQVYRRLDKNGLINEDILSTEDDRQKGVPLIEPVMRDGKRLAQPPSLEQSRRYAAEELSRLPLAARRLLDQVPSPVKIAPALKKLAKSVDQYNT
jgi:nicotinate phosphoribosyltransferase